MFHARIANFFPQTGTKEHKVAQKGTNRHKVGQKKPNRHKKNHFGPTWPKMLYFFQTKSFPLAQLYKSVATQKFIVAVFIKKSGCLVYQGCCFLPKNQDFIKRNCFGFFNLRFLFEMEVLRGRVCDGLNIFVFNIPPIWWKFRPCLGVEGESLRLSPKRVTFRPRRKVFL
jgi:hypothetical protein